MTKAEAIELLAQNRVSEWNAYRKLHSDWYPDLSYVELGNFDIARTDLRGIDLRGTDLSRAVVRLRSGTYRPRSK